MTYYHAHVHVLVNVHWRHAWQRGWCCWHKHGGRHFSNDVNDFHWLIVAAFNWIIFIKSFNTPVSIDALLLYFFVLLFMFRGSKNITNNYCYISKTWPTSSFFEFSSLAKNVFSYIGKCKWHLFFFNGGKTSLCFIYLGIPLYL